MVAAGKAAEDSAELTASSLGSIDLDNVVIDLRDDAPTLYFTEPEPSFRNLEPDELRSLINACDGVKRRLRATRVFDIVAASLLLVVALPVILIAAVMVRVSSGGSVFYASRRHGHLGTTFGAWKLRTMVDEFEQRRILDAHPDIAEQLERECKLLDDPRVTPIGRFLRRTSLDELPQLLNVVRGEMSLVGPRPKTIEEGPRFGPALEPVLSVRPGLTGLWQTSGRNDLPFEDRIVLDLQYVASRSFVGDLRLCLITFRQFLSTGRHGAY